MSVKCISESDQDLLLESRLGCLARCIKHADLLSFSSPGSESRVNIPDEAVVDEEAILSLLENSQSFLPLSQASNPSTLLGKVSGLSPCSALHLIFFLNMRNFLVDSSCSNYYIMNFLFLLSFLTIVY